MSRHRLTVIATATSLWGMGFVLLGGTAHAQVRCNGLEATIVAAPGETEISGTRGDDVIVGTAQDDTIDGGGGDDVICGGAGDDIISGGRGDDVLLGGSGDDEVIGDRGEDFLSGGPGDDVLIGIDRLQPRGRGQFRSDSIDRLDAGGGEDTCFVSARDVPQTVNCEVLAGETGDDDL